MVWFVLAGTVRFGRLHLGRALFGKDGEAGVVGSVRFGSIWFGEVGRFGGARWGVVRCG